MSAPPLTPGFMVVQGNLPEELRHLLVRWFRAHPLAPLENEVILVQSNGIAQWLKLALASPAETDDGGCGIAAAMEMCLPARLAWRAYRAVLGETAIPDTLPFDKTQLIWRLMRLLPALEKAPDAAIYAPLNRFLATDGDLRKRYQLAGKIADLFDQYQVYRADWLAAWERGEAGLLKASGESLPLEADQRWQPRLWRTLLGDVGPAQASSRAAIHRQFMATAATLSERPAALPRRITVFGLSSLPRQTLEVLLALSRFSQILFCVHNPCEHYWGDIVSGKDMARRATGRQQRKAGMPSTLPEESRHLHTQPLLAAWGKQGRDFIALLDELDAPESYRARFERIGERIDFFQSHGRARLLNQLQEDIRELRPVAESRECWPPVDPAQDRSIRFHIAHSAQREVEILHDQLLAALEADPSLRPRDIIVMVPDIDCYAPHIKAVFGQIAFSDARFLPFSMADQQQRHQAPLVFALECLLGAPESRFAVSEMLDLLDVQALRQRFDIDATECPLLRRWIEQTNIRWGLDARHRQSFISGREGPNEAYAQNTWRHGLQRMLLGYATGEDPTGRQACDWHDIEPYGEVAGLEAALAGKLALLLERLETLCETLSVAARVADWVLRLNTMLDDFFLCQSPEDTLLLVRLQNSLHAWAESCEAAAFDGALPLAVVREYWLAQIEPENLNRRFMAGGLTFATLMPMRAIPFRMVCLLGMNDGDYPRSQPPLDFDLMTREYRPGDRSRREDDRYLFLEALLSARETLHVSWVGRSILDNSPRPPSVLVSQLRDHLEAGWRQVPGAAPASLIAALTVDHRLQAFHPDYFGTRPETAPHFTYAREWEREANTAAADPCPPLPRPVFNAPVPLARLIAFLKQPVKTFFCERLGVYYDLPQSGSEDQEPFVLDALEQWALQDRLIQTRLDALLRGESEECALARQIARIRRQGNLPLGKAADLIEAALAEPLARMFDAYRAALADWPTPLDDRHFVHACPPDSPEGQAIIVQGEITQLRASEENRCCISLSSSNLIKDNQYRRDKLLAAWVTHLAGHLDGKPMHSLIIGKNGTVKLPPLPPEEAAQQVSTLVSAWCEGLCAPLPLAVKTGFAWLEKEGTVFSGPLANSNHPAISRARNQYQGGYQNKGEVDEDPWLQRAYPDFEHLWAEGRFTLWCDRLLKPLKTLI